jgi:hypothetical protein
MDVTDTLLCFGSANRQLVQSDFSAEQRDFSVRKNIILESETVSDSEVRAKEVELITAHRIARNKLPIH